MKRSITANELSGRATGALIFSGFGALWFLIALYAREIISVANVSAVVAGFAVLLAGACALLREAKRWPRVAAAPGIWKTFAWVNVLQALAIVVGISILSRLHMDNYNLSVIAFVVGLHFLPLAGLFRYKPHYVTGLALVVWALVSAWLAPAEHLPSTTALGTGAILWLSAVAAIVLAFLAMRRSMAGVAPDAA
jgi:hypothetical protein